MIAGSVSTGLTKKVGVIGGLPITPVMKFINGFANGVAYSCGAARDGGSAWVLQEVVDRYLRLADACGGVNGTDEASNALCPVGSWVRAARLFPGFAFDQRAQIGAVHAAITGSGHHWWVQIGTPPSGAEANP